MWIRRFNQIFSTLDTKELLIVYLLCSSLILPFFFGNWEFSDYLLISEKEIVNDIESLSCLNHENVTSTRGRPYCLVNFDDLESFHQTPSNINESLIGLIPKQFSIDIGGHHKPQNCISRQKVAIIIPFRDREFHLKLFTQHLHPFLNKQLIEYKIYVIEQNDDKAFNRGKLLNIGFMEALKQDNFCCFIFHDVDVLPINQKQIYSCSKTPRHICSNLDKFRYNLIYPSFFGVGTSFSKSQFLQINGFSNMYFGWGGEDDDIYLRVRYKNLKVTRWDDKIARCNMMVHTQSTPNPERMKLLQQGKLRYETDGINSLSGSYQVVSIKEEPLFTKISVNL